MKSRTSRPWQLPVRFYIRGFQYCFKLANINASGWTTGFQSACYIPATSCASHIFWHGKNHWQDALTVHLLRSAKVLWNLRRLPRDQIQQHQPQHQPQQNTIQNCWSLLTTEIIFDHLWSSLIIFDHLWSLPNWLNHLNPLWQRDFDAYIQDTRHTKMLSQLPATGVAFDYHHRRILHLQV